MNETKTVKKGKPDVQGQASWFTSDDVKKPVTQCIHYKPLLRSCIPAITVGDLLIVEQQLCGYKVGEVAAIENVMAKERREFSTRDMNRITDTSTTSFSSEVEESSSTKVDERFSLSTQSANAQNQQTALNGNFSASYKAPAFSATIGASASFSNSKSSSYNASQEYAKNITTEASKRIKESISESKSITIVTENIKTTLKGFNNTEGDTHIQGIYRWVDKEYNAQLFDYGKRLFLHFYVPEPAFYLRDVNKLIENEGSLDVDEPKHPRDRKPSITSYRDIKEEEFGVIAADYDVTEISPPPPPKLVKGKSVVHPDVDAGDTDLHSDDTNEPTLAKSVDSIVVDPGYHLTRFRADIPLVTIPRPDKNGNNSDFRYGYHTTVGFSNTSNDVNILLVNVMGTTCYYVTHNDSDNNDKDIMVNTDRFDEWHTTSLKLEGEIPITVGAEYEGKIYFNLLYEMKRNPETFEQWQMDMYAAVLEGYNNQVRDYEQKLREAELKTDNEIGQLELKPREETYRKIEANEIRKHCVDILTRHSAFVDAPSKLNEFRDREKEINLNSIAGVPNWQANNVNGVTTAFFEESFEWESITTNYYPYFWTDKKRWPDLFRENETGDAQFDQFLKAGYAKVVVPIRPFYEKSVLYFLKTNLVWAGGEVPAFSDDTTLSLLEELHESVQLARGDGKSVGDPWKIDLPTNLVYLQEDSALPEFDCEFTYAGDDVAPDLPSEEDIDEFEGEIVRLTAE